MSRLRIAALCLLSACAAPRATDQLEFFRERILRVDESGDGVVRIGFEYSARVFVIEPQTPQAAQLVEFARAAVASGREVWVTALDRGLGSKAELLTDQGPRGRSPLIVRLADTPDPRSR